MRWIAARDSFMRMPDPRDIPAANQRAELAEFMNYMRAGPRKAAGVEGFASPARRSRWKR